MTGNPAVVSIHENKGRKLHTTSSWKFLGVEHDDGIPHNSIWNRASFGESTIIGNLDTGCSCFYSNFLNILKFK